MITADRQELSAATEALNTATTTYRTSVRTFTDDFTKKDDYAAAQKAFDDATKELEDARLAVIKKLKDSDPAYQAAVKKEADARKKLDQIRASGGSRDQISAQSQVILDAGNAVSKLEVNALAKDAKYQEIKKRQTDASEKLKMQKDALAEGIKSDEDLKSKKQAMDEAQTKKDDAQKKLNRDLSGGGTPSSSPPSSTTRSSSTRSSSTQSSTQSSTTQSSDTQSSSTQSGG